MEIFFIVVFWVAISAAVGVFANQRRNRSGFGWFLLSLLISPLLAFLFLAALKTLEQPGKGLPKWLWDFDMKSKKPRATGSEIGSRTTAWLAAALLAGVIAAAFAMTAHAGEQSRFYDSRGNSVGTATRDSQGTTTFRDSRGTVTGKEYRR